MGYDLHITRRKLWSDDGDDISFEEFVSVVRADPEFTYPGKLGDDSADWRSPKSRYESWLSWSDGQAYTKNPAPEFIDKLVSIALALRAKAQGDDGEVYLSATKVQKEIVEPPTATRSQPRPPLPFLRWPLWKQLLGAFVLGCVLLALKLLIFGE